MAIPLPFALNDANFSDRLRDAVKQGRWIISEHAIKRMRERRITPQQVKACLLSGTIAEPAALTVYGDWKATLERRVAGERIRVAVALEKRPTGEMAAVVTVMKSGWGR